MKTWVHTAAILPIIYVFLEYSPTLFDFNPSEHRLPLPVFEGPLSVNSKLNEAEILLENELLGPESIVFHKGDMYTGIADGRIVKIKNGKVITVAQTGRSCELPYEERLCGRPLGMRIGNDDLLYFVDAYYGIFSMNFTTNVLTRILSSSALVDGKEIIFPDDLDLDDEGNIYFSDASAKWDLSNIMYLVAENDASGRILQYNMKSGKVVVLVSKLLFPNGVQLSKDKKSILFNEFINRRILRHYIKGPKKGQTEVFADNLPGEPDNIRASPHGYWVGFACARNQSTASFFVDTINSYPQLKRLLIRVYHGIGSLLWSFAELTGHPIVKEFAYRFRQGHHLSSFLPNYGIAVEFNEGGKILRSFHSPDGKINLLSEVKEHEGYLYLGSFIKPYLGKLKLP